jgi:type I restriction enzyme S subunit
MNWSAVKIDDIKAGTRYALVGGPFGSNLTTSDYVEEGVPVIRGNNISPDAIFIDKDFAFVSEEKANKLLPNNAFPGDVIVTQRGTLGQVGMIPKQAHFDRYLISQSQMKLTVDPEKADARFVYYFFRQPSTIQAIVSQASSSGVPHINLGVLKDFKILLPPLDAQHHIASILSTYDDLIENNERRIALLEGAARQLYREWFVRLRFPGHEHTAVVDGVPHGWKKKPLNELASITMGQSPESKFYNDVGDGLPFHQGVSDFNERFVSHRIYTTALNRIAAPGDILCSVRAPVGRINITLDKIVVGRGLAALRSRSDHQSFLYQQLKSHFFKEDLIGTGAIFASVTKAELANQRLLVPPEPLIRQFEDFSKSIDEQLRNLFIQNQRSRAARDILLPRLMSGEITV